MEFPEITQLFRFASQHDSSVQSQVTIAGYEIAVGLIIATLTTQRV